MRPASLAAGVVALVACARFTEEPRGADGDASSSSSSSTSSTSSSGTLPTHEVLATGLTAVAALRASPSAVYWIASAPLGGGGTTTKVHFCAAEGCAGKPPTTFGEGAVRIAIAGELLYFTAGPRLAKCAVGSPCSLANDLVVGVGEERATTLAVGGGIAHVGLEDTSSGRLVRCPTGGCNLAPTQTEGQVRVGSMAATGPSLVYFAGASVSNELHRFDNGVTNLGTMPGLPTSVAVSGDHVYFVSQQTLFTCALSGNACAPVVVPGAFSQGVYGLVANPQEVFWTVSGVGGVPGRIIRCAAQPCRTPKEIFEGGDPSHVDESDGWLYWSDRGGDAPGKSAIKRLRL